MAAGAIEPRRLALRYTPPGIIVEYSCSPKLSGSSQTSIRQLYHHEIDLQDLLVTQSSKRLDIDAIVEQLITAHDRVLGDRKVSARQLARLVQKLIDQTAHDAEPAERASNPANSVAAVLPQADYNRVSETQLRQVKQKMDLVFQQNFVRPGESTYQYDKQVAFQPTQEASDWDDDE